MTELTTSPEETQGTPNSGVKGIAHKLALASKEIGAVGKWGQNQHQRYNFRGIEHVINAVHPVFSRLGIVIKVKVSNLTLKTNRMWIAYEQSTFFIT